MARGDEEFVEFATASSAGLRHAAYLLTGDGHAAEEAVQAALVRTYAAWPRVRRDDAFACARRTLVNYVTDRWRRKLKEYPTDDLPEHPAGPDFADDVALRQWVTGALATLTARERAVIVLRYLFDLPGIGGLTAPSPGPSPHVVSPAGHTRTALVPLPSPGRGHDTPRPAPSASAVTSSSPTPTAVPTATGTPTPTPTSIRSAAVQHADSSAPGTRRS